MARKVKCPGIGLRKGKCKNRKQVLSEACRECKDAASHNSSTARAVRLAAGTRSPADALRIENTSLRKEALGLRRALAKAEDSRYVEDALVETFANVLENSPYTTQFDPPPVMSAGSDTAHEMVAVVSDAHYPEVVDPEACFGIDYGPDVCRNRMQRLRNTIIRYKKLREAGGAGYPISKLTLAVNGDMLSGNIHEELEVTNALPMSESLCNMAYMLHDLGRSCAQEFPSVEMVIMPGNHPRLTKKPRLKNKWDNWEWVMGRFVQALSRDEYEVKVPKSLVHVHPVFDFRLGLTHGDGVKASSFAGIPHYALQKKRDKFQSMLRTLGVQSVDMLIYGHFHQLIFDDQVGMLINGSIKGTDEYAMATMYSAGNPVQALLTWHPDYGMTDLSRINLSGRGVE